MTSTLTTTSQTLTERQREHISELIIERYLDSMDVNDLIAYFRDIQHGYHKEFNDEDLMDELANFFDEEEFNEAINYGL